MCKGFFDELFRNTLDCFRGFRIMWHILAIAITYILVQSGFDWFYFEHTRSAVLLSLALPGAVIGFLVPILTPVVLYALGTRKKSEPLTRNSALLAQAGILGWCLSSFYKTFTGRIQPEFYTHSSSVDISHQFQFGFLEHGIFWGWPSSHTTVAFAMSTVLILLYTKNNYIRCFAALYALYIGLSVSVSIHWFSDFIAGALFGTLIGLVVFGNALSGKKVSYW